MKKLIQFVVLLIALFSILSCQEISAGKNSSDDGNTPDPNNSPTGPIYITTVEDLASISNNLSADYILTTDISLSGYEWTPIGSEDVPFTGTFDGDGYTISDLNIEVASGDVAFITYLEEESEVSNLTIEGNVKTEDGSAALLALYCEGIIKNCHTEGIVSGMHNSGSSSIGSIGSTYIGGLIGFLKRGRIINSSSCGVVYGDSCVGGLAGYGYGTISDCNSSCKIVIVSGDGLSNRFIGGLLGYAEGLNVTNCYSTGEITQTYNYICEDVGGLIGEVSYNYDYVIQDCYSTSNINLEKCTNVGGFIGECYSPVINCYCTGTINVTNGSTIGGFIGYNNKPLELLNPDVTIENCYSIGNVTGNSEVGGFVGESRNGSITECYSEGLVQGQYIIGGFIGRNDGDITNCYSMGSVQAQPSDEIDQYYAFGGFCGWIKDGNLYNCYSIGNVIVPTKGKGDYRTSVGGFAGEYELLGSGEILYCRSTGNVSVGDHMDSVGGFLGFADLEKIYSCFCTGNVSCGSNAQYIGGFGGWCRADDMSFCFNTGNLSVEEDSKYIGGFIGEWGSTGVILFSIYSAASLTVSGSGEYVGGLIGRSYNDDPLTSAYFIEGDYDNSIGILKIDGWDDPETFDEAYWDFDTDWEIDENGTKNNGYPYLKSVPLVM